MDTEFQRAFEITAKQIEQDIKDYVTGTPSVGCRSESSDLPPAKVEKPYQWSTYAWMQGMPEEEFEKALEAIYILKGLGLEIRLRQWDTRYASKS